MSSINDLIEELENDELEKQASEENVEELAEDVFQRALEKVAKSKSKNKSTPKAEKDPEEMLEESEDTEELEEIEKEIEKDAAHEKLSSFKFDSEEKQELFEKVASYALANAPRIVRDNNFQQYETLDGMPKIMELFFDAPGEEVNNIY